MKALAPILLIFLTGCPICNGCRSSPPITVTEISGGTTRILLHGPGKNDEYSGIVVFKGAWTPRNLGRLDPSQTKPARLEDLGDGVFRVRWGADSSGPYLIIDTKKEIIVEDSNRANSKNQPFNRPLN